MYQVEVNVLIGEDYETVSVVDLDYYPNEEQALSYVDEETANKYDTIVVQVYCYETGAPELFDQYNYVKS
jgi:hypothetical protein